MKENKLREIFNKNETCFSDRGNEMVMCFDDFKKATDEALSLHIVSNRRELLIAFLMDIEECYGMDEKEKAERCVDDYLSNL